MDLRTLSLLLIITYILQVMALFIQYRANKTYRGIGWWALGFALMAIGFVFLQLRDIISNALITIIFGNTLSVLGTIFLYIGIMRFFDKKENPWIIISILAFFLLPFIYYTYGKNDISARTVIVSAVMAAISFLAAQGLFVIKPRKLTATANFIYVVFLVNGCFFVFRAAAVLLVAPVVSYFTPTLLQVAAFLEPFIIAILLTYGLIILVNQRLSTDTREAKDQFELIFNTGMDATMISRLPDGYIENINDSFTARTGFTRAEAVGKTSMDIQLWKEPADRQKAVKELVDKGYFEDFEAVFQRKDGSTVIGIMSAKLITLQGSQHVLSVTRDITERKRLEDELRQQATLDDLTGVTNRRHFLELALAELNRAMRYDCPLTIALADVDHFKRVNDTYEHTGGDQALQAFVKICQKNIRENDVFARFGGDEFVLLLPETSPDYAHAVIERLREDLLNLAIDLGGNPISITASWGISSVTGAQESLDTLLARADQALYRAKELGRNRVVIWEASWGIESVTAGEK